MLQSWLVDKVDEKILFKTISLGASGLKPVTPLTVLYLYAVPANLYATLNRICIPPFAILGIL